MPKVRQFERAVSDEITAAARKIDRDPAFVDEVRQLVQVRLVVGDGVAPPRIASYRGTGPLRAWVAIAAQRVALNVKRDGQRAVAIDVLAEVVDREPDPELRHLKTLYRAEFRAALTSALAAPPDRQRAVLRLRSSMASSSPADRQAAYRVHESTASRWWRRPSRASRTKHAAGSSSA
jgi:RNA polymerase sigma-70 factor